MRSMNGLELSREYFERYGKPMLEAEFADIMPYLAVGLVGSGSERYGFDDEVSEDHDFEPCFCIFLPSEETVDRRSAFLLERAYAKLPGEFCGYRRQTVSPVGGSRSGVIRSAEFYKKAVGSENAALSTEAWLRIPEYALFEATDGEVFFDNYGEFTRMRESLKRMPEDITKKRLAGNLLIMAQSGQYNYLRCIKHGEPEAAALALGEFVNAALRAYFLMRERYMPYYKWSFRALRMLQGGAELAQKLGCLLSSELGAERKADTVENICTGFANELIKKCRSGIAGNDLERHAYAVNDLIADGYIRNLHILTGV